MLHVACSKLSLVSVAGKEIYAPCAPNGSPGILIQHETPEGLPPADFAVNEQCHEFDECAALSPFIAANKPVFNAEYADVFVTDVERRSEVCDEARDLGLQTLILPVDLDDAFRFGCEQ